MVMATSRRVGNYSTSAKAVVRASDQIFDAAMSGKPDFTAISKEAIKGRSLERRAVTQAEGEVAAAGLKAYTNVNLTKMREDTKKEIADIKRPAKRMAGAVAGLGAIAGGYVSMQNSKKDKAEREAFKAEQAAVWAAADEKNKGYRAKVDDLMSQLQTSITDMKTDTSSLTTKDDSGSSTETNKTTSTPSGSSPAPATVKPTTAKGFRGEVYNYLTQHHKLSKNKALGLMANIDRESSFQINPQGGDGGNSFGMFQWNNTYGRSQRMKENVGDWQTNWKGQIDYALGGNQLSEYNKVTSDFKNTTFESPQQAADYWMKHWERPAHQERDSKKHTQFLSGYNF